MPVILTRSDHGHWAQDLAKRHADAGSLVFAHLGALHDGQLELMLAKADEHSALVKVGVSSRKRLLSLIIEGLENVRNHAPPGLVHTAFAMLAHEAGTYRLVFGNAAPQVTVELLSHRIAILNQMDEADLREHHLRLLATEGRTERGGAGLGLLTMARKSSGPIIAHSFPRDGETAFVALELVLAA